MFRCEFPTNPPPPDAPPETKTLRDLGLEQRVIVDRWNPADPFDALQLNYGDIVLWRRWL